MKMYNNGDADGDDVCWIMEMYDGGDRDGGDGHGEVALRTLMMEMDDGWLRSWRR